MCPVLDANEIGFMLHCVKRFCCTAAKLFQAALDAASYPFDKNGLRPAIAMLG
jgi:hypothetical protein